MIVVATENFEVYHGVVGELRDRGVSFRTIEPGAELPEAAAVALVGPEDEHPPIPTVRTDPTNPRAAVEEAIRLLRGADGRTIVGIDPGDRPGIAVLAGDTIVAVFQVPATDAAAVVRREVADAGDPLVRIGDGARLRGGAVLDRLPDDVPVELVDETGTTPHLGTGVRGSDDVLAAVNIARREGEEIDHREVEPTAGELKRIQERSREQSDDGRTIDTDLARQVAVGELTIEEALDNHRKR
ncbi:MAG: hypothetical protein PPP58_00365 [Natronomonas sp.]